MMISDQDDQIYDMISSYIDKIENFLLDYISSLSFTNCDDSFLCLARVLVDHAIGICVSSNISNQKLNVLDKLNMLNSFYINKPIAAIRFCLRLFGVESLSQNDMQMKFIISNIDICMQRILMNIKGLSNYETNFKLKISTIDIELNSVQSHCDDGSYIQDISLRLLADDPFAGIYYLNEINQDKDNDNNNNDNDNDICTIVYISKCGSEMLHGKYTFDSRQHGHRYTSSDGIFTIIRKIVNSTTYVWYIMHDISNKLYYTCCTNTMTHLPPGYGWNLASDGKGPEPTITISNKNIEKNINNELNIESSSNFDCLESGLNAKSWLLNASKISSNTNKDKKLFTTIKKIRRNIDDNNITIKQNLNLFQTNENMELIGNDEVNTKESLSSIVNQISLRTKATLQDEYLTPVNNSIEREKEMIRNKMELLETVTDVNELLFDDNNKDLCNMLPNNVSNNDNNNENDGDDANSNSNPLGVSQSFQKLWSLNSILDACTKNKLLSMSNTYVKQTRSAMHSILSMFDHLYINNNIQANTLGIKMNSETADILYIFRITVPKFVVIKDSLTKVIELTIAEEQCLGKRSELIIQDEDEDDDDHIGLGFDAEALPVSSEKLYIEACNNILSTGRVLKKAVSKFLLSGIGVDSHKSFTLQKSLIELGTFHTSLLNLLNEVETYDDDDDDDDDDEDTNEKGKENDDLQIPQFPDPYGINSMEEYLHSYHHQNGANETAPTSSIIYNENMYDRCRNLNKNIDLVQAYSIQSCIVNIEHYLTLIFNFIEKLEKKTKSSLKHSFALSEIVVKFLLGTKTVVYPAYNCYNNEYKHEFCRTRKYMNIISSDINISNSGISLDVFVRNNQNDQNKTDKELLMNQNNKCAGCQSHLYNNQDSILFQNQKNYRKCEYFNLLFCREFCHIKDKSVLPRRVLNNFDKSEYLVSQYAKSFLQSIWNRPILHIGHINKNLYNICPELKILRDVRELIVHSIDHILKLTDMTVEDIIKNTIGLKRMYLCYTSELFSLSDLCSSTMLNDRIQLEKLYKILKKIE
jgi:hypothetical protein